MAAMGFCIFSPESMISLIMLLRGKPMPMGCFEGVRGFWCQIWADLAFLMACVPNKDTVCVGFQLPKGILSFNGIWVNISGRLKQKLSIVMKMAKGNCWMNRGIILLRALILMVSVASF